jgi:hypothetical protein
MAIRFRITEVELVTGRAWMVLDRRLQSFLEEHFPTPDAARAAIAKKFGEGHALAATLKDRSTT